MVVSRDEGRESALMEGRVAAPEAPEEFVLAYLVNAFDPGSEVRAIHRVLRGEVGDVRGIAEAAGFSIEQLDPAPSCAELISALALVSERAHAFVFAFPDGSRWRAARDRAASRLDVEVLHDELLPGIGGELSFDANAERLLETVREGDASLGILMNPLAPDELFRVVQQGRVLPQKSTFFSPKIPSGLVLRDF